jgi:hypothetical protein
MAKALYGFLGEPRTSMLLKQLADLKARVSELEKALETAQGEAISLRALVGPKVETRSLDDVGALT